MASYRVTFSATPDVASKLKERARRDGKSISSLVNDLLRSALSEGGKGAGYVVVPQMLPIRPGLDPSRLKEIAAEFEDD